MAIFCCNCSLSRAWWGREFYGCIFHGIQDTTHVTQETDQNYGKFKSLLHQHIQQLLNELYWKYKEKQYNQQELEIYDCLAQPTLNNSHYSLFWVGAW
jgi:hypothetical protein